jgi:hypothetical protein
MLSHTTYKVVHLLGILLLVCGIGGLWALAAAATEPARQKARRLLLATHGVALVLILVAGFGMMARLGISGAWPAWIWIKLAIWLLLAAVPVLLRRVEGASSALFFLGPLLAAIAAWAALFHIGSAM